LYSSTLGGIYSSTFGVSGFLYSGFLGNGSGFLAEPCEISYFLDDGRDGVGSLFIKSASCAKEFFW
jgi:hypothetical protein